MDFKAAGITSLQTYMDGGSLGVSFVTQETKERCTLMLRIDWDTAFDRSRVKPDYRLAELHVFRRTAYTSPVTGITMPYEKEEVIDLAWGEAASLLRQLEPHFESFKSEVRWIFPAMVQAVSEKESQ